jgi:archaellum component FlaC
VLLPDELLRLPEIVRELTEAVKQMAERWGRVEEELGSVKGRLDNVEEELRGVKGRLDSIEGRLDIVEKRLEGVDGRLEGVDGRLDSMENRQERMERELKDLRDDVARLKGSDRERFYRERACAIFGRWLDKGRDATNLVARSLRAALKAGQMTIAEQDDILDADLLWLGKYEEREIFIVGEASWMIAADDVRRAAERAAILRRLGFDAIAFAGGVEWTDEVYALARELQVLSSRDGKIDREFMNRLLGIAS